MINYLKYRRINYTVIILILLLISLGCKRQRPAGRIYFADGTTESFFNSGFSNNEKGRQLWMGLLVHDENMKTIKNSVNIPITNVRKIEFTGFETKDVYRIDSVYVYTTLHKADKDKVGQFYDNIVATKKLSISSLGTRKDFIKRLSNVDRLTQYRQELLDNGIFNTSHLYTTSDEFISTFFVSTKISSIDSTKYIEGKITLLIHTKTKVDAKVTIGFNANEDGTTFIKAEYDRFSYTTYNKLADTLLWHTTPIYTPTDLLVTKIVFKN